MTGLAWRSFRDGRSRAAAFVALLGWAAACDGEGTGADGDAHDPDWPVLPECIFDWGGMRERLDHEVLRGAGPGGVSYRLWRCLTGQGAGHTGAYRADAFELVFGGRAYRVGAGDDLAYEWTHHNWYDSLVATHPEAILRWRAEAEVYGSFELRYFVSATDPTGATTLLPETRVE